jgi:hypothetical protein
MQVKFACNWWLLEYNLNVTGSQSHSIFASAGGQYNEKWQYNAKPPVF